MLMWILWMVFFFQGMALGCWFPSLTNIFGERGLEDWVPIAFMIPPCCALVGPLLTGALAARSPASHGHGCFFCWFPDSATPTAWRFYCLITSVDICCRFALHGLPCPPPLLPPTIKGA